MENKTLIPVILTKVRKYFRKFIIVLGWILFIAIILSFTDIPFYAYYWLGTHSADIDRKPDYIVLLGGVGMPSPEDLMRTYFAAGAYLQVPTAKVIIAFPPDTFLEERSPELLMAKELTMRGVDTSDIIFEKEGYSTYTQAINVSKIIGENIYDSLSIRIITAPEHMYRAVKTFRKTGFRFVGGTPTFESAIKEDELIKGKRKKSEKRLLNIRYNMWSYLKYEITVVRELCAIMYYELRGWM